MIPHLIHRVWLGGPEPADYQANGQAWAALNPGWQVRTWGDDDVAEVLPGHLRPVYDQADRHARGADVWRLRSDLARAVILARHGGVYVDADFVPVRPIGDLLDTVGCFAVEERPGVIANGIMGATAGHPFMAALVAALGAHPTGRPVWQMTGPGLLTAVAAGRDDLDLLPTELFYPYHHRDLAADPNPTVPADCIAHHTWGSARRRVSLIVPWRDTGCEHRAAAWAHVRARYEADHPDWQIVECVDDGEAGWAKGQAINDGLARAAGDVVAVVDADLILPGLAETVERVQQGRSRVAMPYQHVHRLDAASTTAVLAGAEPTGDMAVAEGVYGGVLCGGAVVADRAAVDLAPPDPRFRGWGGEDEAWGDALTTLVGKVWRHPSAPLFHLWHPPAERMSRDVGNEANAALRRRYLGARGRRASMRNLIAEWRTGAAPEVLAESPSGWWRSESTGALRYCDPASPSAERIAMRGGWTPCEAPS